jgi:hypothetical protein
MSKRKRTASREKEAGSFVHRLNPEQLTQLRDAPAEAKLQWLEEANAFVRQFVSARKLSRWKAFVTGKSPLSKGSTGMTREPYG